MTEAEELELLELEEAEAQARGSASAHAAPPPPPQVGQGETFLNSGANMLPLGKQAVDGLSALAMSALRPSPGAHLGSAAREAGLKEATAPGLIDTYRDVRDTREGRTAAGEAQNPWTARGGKAFGLALSLAAPLPKVRVGMGAGGRVLSNALTGAGYQSVNSLANGKADWTRGDVGQAVTDFSGADQVQDAINDASSGHYGKAALDALSAGPLGGALGGTLVSGLLEGGRAAVGTPLAKSLGRLAIDQGRRVLTNGADSLSKRAALSEPAVAEAIRSGGIKPFGTTAGAFERLQGIAEGEHVKYREIVSQLEARGVKGPHAEALAQQLLDKAADLDKNTMNEALPELYLDAAGKVMGKAESSGQLGLTQNENLKRSLQAQVKYGRFEDTPVNEVRRDIASVLRRGSEEAIDSQVPQLGPEARALGAQFVPVKQRLGRLLEAEGAAERGAARGAQRNHFGMKDVAAATAAAASGHGLAAAPIAVGSHFLNNRFPSAVASYGLSAADALRRNAPATGDAAYRLQAILRALREPQQSRQATPDQYMEGGAP